MPDLELVRRLRALAPEIRPAAQEALRACARYADCTFGPDDEDQRWAAATAAAVETLRVTDEASQILAAATTAEALMSQERLRLVRRTYSGRIDV